MSLACSEASSVVVEVFNREELLPLILELLQPTTLPLSLCLAAGQYLGKHVSPVLYYVWQQVHGETYVIPVLLLVELEATIVIHYLPATNQNHCIS